MQTLESLQVWCKKKNLPNYRAKQIYQAITKNLISNWSEALELPKDWHEILNKEIPISTLRVKKILPDEGAINRAPTDANTIKIAFQTHDDLIIETVLMRHDRDRNTVCVSTQVGCAMNCAFCATGKLGFTRNLSAEEIVDQVLEFARLLNATRCRTPGYSPMSDIGIMPSKVTNIVFMGMGEPFLNYENVIEAIKILNDKDGFNLGHRHMTISTSGIVPGILKFADEDIQTNLAISLHASNNKLRSKLMPVNKKYPLEKLLPAVSLYMKKTNRKVFFEYILFAGINDSRESTEELVALMKTYFPNQMQLVHINLIGYNPIGSGAPLPTGLEIEKFESPSKETIKKVADTLQKNSILVTIRYHFGGEINAACGQLGSK
ncbi:MAG: 23S rRNA (adenine(2503)-C(2))-methyltransferase RlmN [Patescibacteria group bacterium]|nr:23S rRNA (adenine(2503)-C(2))-methyltransferase RlmN [Patescibacteria group bacterium]